MIIHTVIGRYYTLQIKTFDGFISYLTRFWNFYGCCNGLIIFLLLCNDNLNLENKLNGNIMTESEQEKDLGFRTSGTLLWNDQISACINKANKMTCWKTRNLISREKVLMLRIYKALVRPHLEYCVQLWNPAPEHGNWSTILKIEGVQRRFTRMIDEVGLLPYSERLEVLKLTTLIERRTRGDLIEVFKSKKDLSNINGIKIRAIRIEYNIEIEWKWKCKT